MAINFPASYGGLTPYGGLLGPDQKKAARTRGLLGAAAQMMAASGPSRTPVPLGATVGRGLLAGTEAADKYSQQAAQGMFLKAQLDAARAKANAPISIAPGHALLSPDTFEVLAQTPPLPKNKTGINLKLPNGTIILSLDGGRSYIDPETKKSVPVPPTAIRVSPDIAATEGRTAQAVAQARTELGGLPPASDRDLVKAALEHGTGVYSNLAAAFDAVAGGIGADKVFGLKGFFPATQNNRQALRLVKQQGKPALLNSSRGAIWEQKNIDKLFPDPDRIWTNPATEARKIPTLREALQIERRYNTEAIASGALSPDDVEKLVLSNIGIDKTLALIGDGTPSEAATDGAIPTVTSRAQAQALGLVKGDKYFDEFGNSRTLTENP